MAGDLFRTSGILNCHAFAGAPAGKLPVMGSAINAEHIRYPAFIVINAFLTYNYIRPGQAGIPCTEPCSRLMFVGNTSFRDFRPLRGDPGENDENSQQR